MAISGLSRQARLWQLVSPALPVGGYSYSQGLETAISFGWLCDEESAVAWILGAGERLLGSNDLPYLAAMLDALASTPERLGDLDVALIATRETYELRLEDRQLGSALLRLLRSLVESGALQAPARSAGRALPLTQSFAAAFAQAAELLELTVDETLAAYAWVWFENQVAAAVKLVPLGQTAGQRILLTCGATLERLVTTAQAVPLAEAGATLAGVALASAAHETQYSRLFRS